MILLHSYKANGMKNALPVLIVLSVVAVFSGCQTKKKAPDVSGIHVNVQVQRFEKDLFGLNLDSLPQQIPELKKKYGTFMDLFSNRIIQVGRVNEPDFPELLKKYLTDYSVNRLYTSCMNEYPEVDFLNRQLDGAFRYYAYYFPGKGIPHVYTFVGGFSQSIATSDNILAIALEKYLGRNNAIYNELNPPLPQYLKFNMEKEMMASDAMKGWLMTEFPKPDSLRTLLDEMIYNGKVLCVLHDLMPQLPDTLLLGYSPEQMKWCLKNEGGMWTYLVENKLLFKTDQFEIRKFIEESPYTKAFERYSPGRAGVWIGWRLVSRYLEKNPAVTPAMLMAEQDYMKILQESRYDP